MAAQWFSEQRARDRTLILLGFAGVLCRSEMTQARLRPARPLADREDGQETGAVNHTAKRLGRRPGLPPLLRPSTRPQHPAADAPAGIGNVLTLPSPDWLQQTVTFTGPDDQLAALREAAAGSGFVPWHIDYDQLEEDWVYRLHGSMTLHAAKILARELRDAVWQAHETALGGIISRAVPFDLNALVPVPHEVLRLGHDDPKALAWMWEQWGTTWSLRRVEVADRAEMARAVLLCRLDTLARPGNHPRKVARNQLQREG